VILEILTLGVIISFTLLAFRGNAVRYLSLSFFVVYLIELYAYSQGTIVDFFQIFACKSSLLDIGIFTAIYLHSLSPGHIFFNILIFFLVGVPFESRVGSFKFTSIFLISGVIANIIYALFLAFYDINSFLIGASGAIFGIMGAFLILYPNDEITMFLGPILLPRIKVKYSILAFMAVEFLATMLWVNDGVAHGAHVVGAVTGAILGRILGGVEVHSEESKLNNEIFESLASTPELKTIYERIKNEDGIVRDSWILEFFRKINGDARLDGKYVLSGGKKYRVFR
jgi:membrane associated rhomboid family serine protease